MSVDDSFPLFMDDEQEEEDDEENISNLGANEIPEEAENSIG